MRKMTSMLLVMVAMLIATSTYADKPLIGAINKQENIRDRNYSAAEEELWGAEEVLIANVTIENNSKIIAYSPQIRITGAFNVERGSTFRAGVPVFKVHFINMVDPYHCCTKSPSDVIPGVGIDFTERPYNVGMSPPYMTQPEFERFCQNEIDILNYYFKSDDGKQLVKFVMKDAQLWDDNMENTNYFKCTSQGFDELDCPKEYFKCGLLGVAPEDCPEEDRYYPTALQAFNDVDFASYRHRKAINIVFFDNPANRGSGKGSGASYNLDNGGPPIIIIDYQRVDENLGHDHDSDGVVDDCGQRAPGARADLLTASGDSPLRSLNNGIQDDDHDRRGVEPHEMGHIFGLQHVCRQHPYDINDLWDQVMTGGLARLRPYPTEECEDYCDFNDQTPKPDCQHWFRTSFFSKEPISREDEHRGDDPESDGIINDYYLYIQSYQPDDALDYENDYYTYGQAEIIMNMAYHFKSQWSLE